MRIINLFVGGVMCALVSGCATPPKPTQPEGEKIVICSAMGRDGFPYSTSNLNKICLEDYISNKERDRLLANGEIISSIRMSYILNQNKIKSYALSYLELGIIGVVLVVIVIVIIKRHSKKEAK